MFKVLIKWGLRSLQVIVIMLFVTLLLFLLPDSSFSQNYDVPLDAVQSVQTGVEETQQAINKVEEGLKKAREVVKTLKVDKETKKNLLQQITDTESALNQSKAPLNQFSKYSHVVNSASELYSEISEINKQYERDKNMQGSLAANLRILSRAMENYGGKVPILGDAINMYGTATTALLDKTEKVAVDIDENRNQGSIGGPGYYKAGPNKEKYEIFKQKFPYQAENFNYIPQIPSYVYKSAFDKRAKFIWDEESKDFYKVAPDVPVENLFKLRTLSGRRPTPYELKIMSDKYETVIKPKAQASHKIATMFETIAEDTNYGPLKKAFYEVKQSNYDRFYDVMNDPELFRAKYLFDMNFKAFIDRSLAEIYNKIADNPASKADAEFIRKYASENGVDMTYFKQPQQVATNNNRINNNQNNYNNNQNNYNNNQNGYNKKQIPQNNQSNATYKPASTYQNEIKEISAEQKKLKLGKLTCDAYMQVLAKDVEKTNSRTNDGSVYTLEITRNYQYDDGFCVGSHSLWRKIPGKEPYREYIHYSPESPARIPAGEIRSYWGKKYPELNWGK